MSKSLFRIEGKSKILTPRDGTSSGILLNVGTVIPVNPLNMGDMNLANACYQSRNAIMALRHHAVKTTETMNEIMYQVREQHSFNLKMTETVKWLIDVVEETSNGSNTSSDWCNFGSQALNTVSSLCYGIPVVGTVFASLFKNASVLVDWYGESIARAGRVDQFDVRRTAYFDNLPNFSSTSSLGLSLTKMEDEVEKLELLNRSLSDADQSFYEYEQWMMGHDSVEQGINFFGILQPDGLISPNSLGIAFPVITRGEKYYQWVAFDFLSKVALTGAISCEHSSLRKSTESSLFYNLMGNNKSGTKIVKRSMTPMFSLDGEMVIRVQELKRLSPYLSNDSDRCMSQIHGFLQLGGRVGEVDQ